MSPKHIKKETKRKTVLHKTSNYSKNCSNGFRKKGFCNIHHILCLTSIANRREGYPAGVEQYLEDCLAATNWDINDKHNLVGLPLNRQYRVSQGKRPSKLPSHQVDHNTRDGYTNEVSEYLEKNVWNTLTAKQEVHEVDVESLREALRGASDEFRKRILDRGKRKGGTQTCWSKRFEPEYINSWYYPFSMGKVPSHRSAGVNVKDLRSVFKKL